MTSATEGGLEDILARVAARTPAPGGGASAAMSCALAAALVEMGGEFARGRSDVDGERVDEISATAAQLKAGALALAEADVAAVTRLMELRASSVTEPGRPKRLELATDRLIEVPLTIAEHALEVAQLASELMRRGSPHLTGDVLTGLLIAEAVVVAATSLVELNVADREDPRVDRADRLRASAAGLREDARRATRPPSAAG